MPIRTFKLKTLSLAMLLVMLLIAALAWRQGADVNSASIEMPKVAELPSMPLTTSADTARAEQTDTGRVEAAIAQRAPKPKSAGGTLVLQTRPDWQLSGTLTQALAQLMQAATYDNEAAYILGMNLQRCQRVPVNDADYQAQLLEVQKFNDGGLATDRLAQGYAFCQGVATTQRSQFYAYLQLAADSGFVPAQEAIARLTPEYYMQLFAGNELTRDDYVAMRSAFVEKQAALLASAAEHGSLTALITLSQRHHAQTYTAKHYSAQTDALDSRLQAYAFNRVILTLADDNELYNRYNWFVQRAMQQFNPDEIAQAEQIAQQWLTTIYANGSLYPAP